MSVVKSHSDQSQQMQRASPMNQSEIEANTKCGKARASKSRLVLGLLQIGWESGARRFSQSQNVAITFDTQLKTVLSVKSYLKALDFHFFSACLFVT